MKQIKFNKYLLMVGALLTTIALIVSRYIVSYEKLYQETIAEFKSAMMESYELQIKEDVDMLVHTVEAKRQELLQEFDTLFVLIEKQANKVIANNELDSKLKLLEQMEADNYIEWIVWNQVEERIEYTTDTSLYDVIQNEQQLIRLRDTCVKQISIPFDDGERVLMVGISKESQELYIKKQVIESMQYIEKLDDLYIWIDEVECLSATDHKLEVVLQPNKEAAAELPLIKNMPNIVDGFPYMQLVEKVHHQGEALEKYYYHTNDADNVDIGLIYARLYPEYDWIIGSGLYLDQLEEHNKKFYKIFTDTLDQQALRGGVNLLGGIGITLIGAKFVFSYQERKKRRLLEEKNKLMNAHYRVLEKRNGSISKTLHDIKNHIIYIYRLSVDNEPEQVVDYIESMSPELHQTEGHINTGNKMLDIILDNKMQLAEENNIRLECKIEKVGLDFIDVKDLNSMISNIFNNAIESAQKCEKRAVQFYLYNFNQGYIVIKLVNSCSCAPICVGDKLLSTKEDNFNHGYGMVIVRTIVERYSGELEWSYDAKKKEFTTIILLPID